LSLQIQIPLPSYIATESYPETLRLNAYLRTVRNPIFGRWKFDKWQVDDIRIAINPLTKELMFLRNRGGSKTRDFTCLAVWFGYQKNDQGDPNRMLWYSASDTQLVIVLKYFKENRYVNRNACSNTKITLWNGNVIEVRIMSEKQAVSPRSDYIFYDEEQSMDVTIYQMSLGTMVGGTGKKFHSGTTEMDTVLDTNYQKLFPKGLVLEHHVNELSWTTEAKELENYAGQPQFVIDSQLYCKWVRPGGIVFEHVEERKMTREEIHNLMPGYYYGVDPNPKNGHTIVGLRYIGKKDQYGDWSPYAVYVFEELGSDQLEFLNPGSNDDDSILFSREIQKRLVHNAVCEVEENAGEEFLKTFEREIDGEFEGRIQLCRWNEENKSNRVFSIRRLKIIINPKCKQTIHHVRTAVWNPKEPKAKLLKSPDQHYLDSFIHACQLESAVQVSAY